jgi:galactokinase
MHADLTGGPDLDEGPSLAGRPDLAGRLDLTPGVRMTSYAYSEVFGCAPTVVWQVPGTVTLLASGPLRLTVAARWGAIAAAGPRPDDVIELLRMEAPGERAGLTIAEAAAGAGPSWAGTGPQSARAGARLVISIAPPAGCGLGAAAAAETAIASCLGDIAIAGRTGAETAPAGTAWPPVQAPGGGAPHALLGGKRFPLDLEAAGLRLAVIDTRVRRAPRPMAAEQASLEAAAAALRAGDLAALGPMLTAAHKALTCDDEQEIAVSTAVAAGALGARMITDGPGRPVCALVPAARLPAVRAALRAEFARRGLRTPRLLTIASADGPRRVSTAP